MSCLTLFCLFRLPAQFSHLFHLSHCYKNVCFWKHRSEDGSFLPLETPAPINTPLVCSHIKNFDIAFQLIFQLRINIPTFSPTILLLFLYPIFQPLQANHSLQNSHSILPLCSAHTPTSAWNVLPPYLPLGWNPPSWPSMSSSNATSSVQASSLPLSRWDMPLSVLAPKHLFACLFQGILAGLSYVILAHDMVNSS